MLLLAADRDRARYVIQHALAHYSTKSINLID